jgi:hypothetical protein
MASSSDQKVDKYVEAYRVWRILCENAIIAADIADFEVRMQGARSKRLELYRTLTGGELGAARRRL